MIELRVAFRQLRKSPGFTAVAVCSLALGIGACVSIFSVANAMLLRDRPYRDPGRLLWVWQRDQTQAGSWAQVSVPNFLDWQRQVRSFEQLAAFRSWAPDLEPAGADAMPAERIGAGSVTLNLFSILGVAPVLGRTFLSDDEKERVVVLSYGLWQGRYQADPNILHRTLRLSGTDYKVIGVMPAAFHFPPVPEPDLLWVPRSLDGKQSAEAERGHQNLYVLGRLKPDVSGKAAQAELDTLMERLAREYPATNQNQGAVVHHLKNFWHHPFERIIYVLLGAVGLLILMACFNVANLLLAKATARRQEIALRVALGARRFHIIRQLLLESLLLSMLGGAAGLVLAFGGTRLLAATIPTHNYRVGEIQIDTPVLVFAVLLSIGTGLLFGLVPALTTATQDLAAALKEGSRQGEGRRPQRLRHGLVVAQLTLAVVLLTGALVTVQRFFEMRRAEWGFQPARLLTARLPLPARYSNSVQFLNFQRDLQAGLSALPGVTAVATSTDLPLAGNDGVDRRFRIEDRPGGPTLRSEFGANLEWISPNYFQTLGVTLVEGHEFTEQEFVSGANVAIINRALAAKQFPKESPVGKRLRLLPAEDGTSRRGKEPLLEIIGVAGDVRRYADQEPLFWIYLPYAQNPTWDLALAIRTMLDPAQMAPAIRRVVATLDPQLPVVSIKTMPERMHDSMADDRVQLILWLLFAGVAVGLAAIGLYGVLSFSVARRTGDIAVQMALGAQPGRVIRQVMAGGLRLTLAGLMLGLVLSWIVWRVVSSQLYVGRPPEPLVQVCVALLLVGVAALACLVPARRATQIDPMKVLRHE